MSDLQKKYGILNILQLRAQRVGGCKIVVGPTSYTILWPVGGWKAIGEATTLDDAIIKALAWVIEND